MSKLTFLRDLLLPPHCVGCGKLQRVSPANTETPPLCPDCMRQWEREKREACPQCMREAFICRCMPTPMKRHFTAFLKLAFYSEESRVISHIVSRLKQHRNARAVKMLAGDARHTVLSFCKRLDASVSEAGREPPETVITHLPRARRSVRRDGHDQAALLAKEIARQTDLPYVTLVKRRRDGKPQKNLTREERMKNLKGAFELLDDVAGLRVILVDDLVTTGAGMCEVGKLLKSKGAVEVLSVAPAYTRPRASSKDQKISVGD